MQSSGPGRDRFSLRQTCKRCLTIMLYNTWRIVKIQIRHSQSKLYVWCWIIDRSWSKVFPPKIPPIGSLVSKNLKTSRQWRSFWSLWSQLVLWALYNIVKLGLHVWSEVWEYKKGHVAAWADCGRGLTCCSRPKYPSSNDISAAFASRRSTCIFLCHLPRITN